MKYAHTLFLAAGLALAIPATSFAHGRHGGTGGAAIKAALGITASPDNTPPDPSADCVADLQRQIDNDRTRLSTGLGLKNGRPLSDQDLKAAANDLNRTLDECRGFCH